MALKVKRFTLDDPASGDPVREDPAELTAKLSGAVAHLPTTRAPPPLPAPPASAPKERTVLVNFRASRQLAKAVQQASAAHGGTRRWLAKLLHDQGYAIPAEELTAPPVSRRTYD